MIARRDDTRHNDCVDETSCNFASSHREDDRKGRRAAVFGRQTFIVVGHVQANDKNRQDVEDQDPPEYIAHYARKRLGRVLGLSCCDGDTFGAAVCEGSRHED